MCVLELNVDALPILLSTEFYPGKPARAAKIIGAAPITQLRMCVIKILTLNGGHLMWYIIRNCS